MQKEIILDKVMPWVSSTAFHISLILIISFIVFATSEISADNDIDKPIFSMTYQVSENGNGTTPFKPVNMDDGDLDKITQNIRETLSDGFDRHGVEQGDLDKILSHKSSSGDLDAIFGGNGKNVLGNGLNGINRNGEGSGDYGPGRLAAYNPKESIGFLPSTRGASRIVYLIDHSGSMVDTFDFLRVEINKKINCLLPIQNFSVIMFSEDVLVLNEMKQANKENKEKLGKKWKKSKLVDIMMIH